MNEQFVRVGGIELCWSAVGDPRHPTVLLIMGLGLSMDWWRDEFCAELAARGFRVVRLRCSRIWCWAASGSRS
jgi:pimeloyl-ACP methyl ester carboxylesterase